MDRENTEWEKALAGLQARFGRAAVPVQLPIGRDHDFTGVVDLLTGKAWTTGDIEAGMVTVGMSGGLINDIPTCKELVATTVSDAEQIISQRLASMVSGA